MTSSDLDRGPILVTGVAGFIGFHLARRLVEEGWPVIGTDNINTYYDVSLKRARLAQFDGRANFRFVRVDVTDQGGMAALFAEIRPRIVVHLAAQAGVRYSIDHPEAYVESNLVGFLNVLEGCRKSEVDHLIFASSSSVYGANTRSPFSVHDPVDHPLSLYAASKKANELMAHSYSHMHGMRCTGLRFFTVYGPWGRPDMAIYLFTDAILAGRPIEVFNNGKMFRDFTYIDDIVAGIRNAIDRPPQPNPDWNSDSPDPATSYLPYRIYNLGNNRTVELSDMIGLLEACLGRKAEQTLLPMQPGDVPATHADIEETRRELDFEPATPIEVGIPKFVEWYKRYNRIE